MGKKLWRPENWYVLHPNECVGCTNKVEDDWGKMCHLSCGKYAARCNFEAGADAMLEALLVQEINLPEGGSVYLLHIPEEE